MHQYLTTPLPNECHPAYLDMRDSLLSWLDGELPQVGDHLQVPYRSGANAVSPAANILADGPDYRVRVLTRHRAWGLAPYVGQPFVYVWSYARDEMGRCVAGSARIVPIPTKEAAPYG